MTGPPPDGGPPDGAAEPDRCRARKVWTDPNHPTDVSVSRVGPAYYLIAGPDAAGMGGWAKVLPDGRLETLMAVPAGADRTLGSGVMLAADADDRLVAVSHGASATDTRDRTYFASVLKRGTAAYAPVTPLLTAFYRGTSAHAFRASFDGRRALFATGHVAVQDPLAVMVGAEGQRIGEQVGVATTSRLFDLGIIPTLRGGVLHALERGDGGNTWHAVELDAAGTVVMRAKVNVGEGAHAVVAADGPRGPIVTWLDAGAQPRLARVDRTTGTADGPQPLPAGVSQVMGLSAMARGVALLARDASSKVSVLWLDDAAALVDTLAFPGVEPRVEWIPTEGGLLAFTQTSSDGVVSLTEVTCGTN